MKRTKDELLQSCIEQFEHIDSVNNNPTLNTTESLIREIKKAINYTHSCKSDSEQLDADFISIVGKEAHFYKDGKIFKKEKLKFSD